MQSDLPITTTLGQVCAKRIGDERKRFIAVGTTFMLSDIARIIDHTAIELGLLPAKPQPVPSVAITGDLKAGTNIPPTPQEVMIYGASIGYPLDGHNFCDSYESKGWLVGRAKMKNWRSAVRNWKTNGWGKLLGSTVTVTTRDYSKI